MLTRLILLHQPHSPTGLIHIAQLLALCTLDEDIVADQVFAEKTLERRVCLHRREGIGQGLGELSGNSEGGTLGVVEGCCVVWFSLVSIYCICS